MKKYFYLSLALFALSCESESGKQAQHSIALQNKVTASDTSRANNIFDLDTALGDGEKVHLWVDKNDGTPLYKNKILVASHATGIIAPESGALAYPLDAGETYNMYALHMNLDEGKIEDDYEFGELGDALTHTVSLDQYDGDGYQKSDLIYGIKKGITPSGEAVNPDFKHLLSKIELRFKNTNANISDVMLKNTYTQASFNLRKELNGLSYPPVSEVENSEYDIKMRQVDALNFSAITVHQTIFAETELFSFYINKKEFKYFTSEDIRLYQGKCTIFEITVGINGIDVARYAVSDWSSGDAPDLLPTDKEDTIYINTAKQLAKIGKDPLFPLDGHYTVLSTLTISGEWTPIGSEEEPFTGTVDFLNNDVTINGVNTSLFGYIENATIKNIAHIDYTSAVIYNDADRMSVAALALNAKDSTFENIEVRSLDLEVESDYAMTNNSYWTPVDGNIPPKYWTDNYRYLLVDHTSCTLKNVKFVTYSIKSI